MDTLRVREVAAAALDWWKQKRPINWTDLEHVASPTVNCLNDSERNLATSVAAMLLADCGGL
jgi:hypothetical protein